MKAISCMLLCLDVICSAPNGMLWGMDYSKHSVMDAPQSFDWRWKGVVFPVTNQGQIGESILFDILGAIESYSAIKRGRLVRLSLPELSDCCDPKPLIDYHATFNCVAHIGGLCSEADYPSTTGSCRNNSCSAQVEISGGMSVKSGSEVDLQAAVLKNPVVVAVDASHTSFQLYRGGIYSDKACSTTKLDHTMLVVGYGENGSGEKYWICQNSWGTSWGMEGYMFIAKDAGNMCGIATSAAFPV